MYFSFFNPFSINIFRTVIHNIWESYERNRREVHIILYYPPYDYLQFLHQGTSFELLHEVHLENETNVNERLCVFALKKSLACDYNPIPKLLECVFIEHNFTNFYPSSYKLS